MVHRDSMIASLRQRRCNPSNYYNTQKIKIKVSTPAKPAIPFQQKRIHHKDAFKCYEHYIFSLWLRFLPLNILISFSFCNILNLMLKTLSEK